MGTGATKALVALRWTQRVATVFTISHPKEAMQKKKQGVIFLWGFAGALLVPSSLPKAVRGLHSTAHSLGTLVHVLQELGADGDKQEEENSNQLQ